VIPLPLVAFIVYFAAAPAVLADKLEATAEQLVRRWKAINWPIVDGNRKSVGWSAEIWRHEWRGAKGKKEISVFEISLNTYFFTTNNRDTKNPNITTKDLKVLIKVRSTVSLDSRPDKSSLDAEGMSLNNRGEKRGEERVQFRDFLVLFFFFCLLLGYNQNFRHFLNILRSRSYLDMVERVKQDYEEFSDGCDDIEVAKEGEFLSEGQE
jgi:hypothetical protein